MSVRFVLNTVCKQTCSVLYQCCLTGGFIRFHFKSG